jgi:hypothetical protein
MNTYLVSMQYFDEDAGLDGIWVDIERVVVDSSEDAVIEWAGDLGFQVFEIRKLNNYSL